jgi:hypothetical protein
MGIENENINVYRYGIKKRIKRSAKEGIDPLAK